MTGKLCPTGWHVPLDDEWILLESYLGGADVAGIKLKEAGFEHWKLTSRSRIATNESGFEGLPSGYRWKDGTFNKIGESNMFWGSTGCDYPGGRYRTQSYDGDFNFAGCQDIIGASVRCVKD
jgi:uncharacterized protein (TIGR02145 family)